MVMICPNWIAVLRELDLPELVGLYQRAAGALGPAMHDGSSWFPISSLRWLLYICVAFWGGCL